VTSFPRQHARTRRFTLGIPRSVTVSPCEPRLVFLRSTGGEDPATSLWELDLGADEPGERCVVDVRQLGVEDLEALPAEERARRERAREMAEGITSYATDREVRLVAFTVGGRVHTVELAGGRVVEHDTVAAFDPRPSPDGTKVVYVSGDGLYLLDLVGGPSQPGVTRPLVIEPDISWGRAEFVAAEEMGRGRGVWWSPEGDRVAATRVDESAVPTWYVADPANPDRAPQALGYPAAGTTNADVRLAVLSIEGGRRVDVNWDRKAFPYLARVGWDDRLTIQVQSRDQRTVQVLTADPETGAAELVHQWDDARWVELVPGTPAWAGDRLVTVQDLADHGPAGSRALLIDGQVVTPPGAQVRSVVLADDEQVVFTASDEDPTQTHVWCWRPDAGLRSSSDAVPGVHAAVAAGAVRVLTTTTLEARTPRVVVRSGDGPDATSRDLAVHAADPVVEPEPRLLELGPRRLRAALLLPRDGSEAGGSGAAAGRSGAGGSRAGGSAAARLPVLLDPYGGPHAQRVVRSRNAYLTSQWLADQGFAVLVVDGRGTPGRGPAWEREVHRDLATPVLEDQIDALYAAAELEPRLDLTRVAIRGWSFGGYLAALAVLRRPDVFHAAVAGAPVTDWTLYDTHYTERYLGHPEHEPAAYEVSSLVDRHGNLLGAAPWTGADVPALLMVHGLADDNVVAAHTLRLSSALLAEGRPHRFLPLSGVTHMTPQEVVAENLLLSQVAFLHEALGDRDTG
jgi:dipeptidyl-peptidase 4